MIKKIILLLFLSFSFVQLDFVTVRHTCDYLGGSGPEFYGFPFIYRTEIPWVNTFEGNLYMLGFIGNFIFYFVILFSISLAVMRLKINKRIMKITRRIISGITVLVFTLALVTFTLTEWEYKWNGNDFKTHEGKEIKCKKHWGILNPGV